MTLYEKIMMGEVYFKRLQKYVCCTLNVTIGVRIIGFIGIMISVLLITVLLNDKYFDKEESYDMSRKTALAFGLDWQHLHWKASTVAHNDPEGKKISIIVIFYSAAFLLLNLILCLGTITGDWRCAVPWLVCELFGCMSKFGALIYHLSYDENLSTIFIVGSIVYIVVMVWWWVVVFVAQLSWRRKDGSESKLELFNISAISMESQDTDILPERIHYFKDSLQDSRNMDSPGPYRPNNMYALI